MLKIRIKVVKISHFKKKDLNFTLKLAKRLVYFILTFRNSDKKDIN